MKYESSTETRNALIEAAGELFSLRGYAEVTTREIAKSACENIGSIHYHFGGKEGLLEAVIEYTLQGWKNDPFGKYLKDNEALLKTKEGKIKFIDGLAEFFFQLSFGDNLQDFQDWRSTFSLQVLQRRIPGHAKIIKEAIEPMTRAFIEIHRRITGADDYLAAHVWFHCNVSPAFMLTLNSEPAGSAFKDGKLPKEYRGELLRYCKESMKHDLDLI